jgi:AcrR family transcriptional regulator
MGMEESKTTAITAKAELTRQRILESALHLFGVKGYEGTTMRDIAAEAGCSLGLTYRYFSSKEELVLVLYRSLAEELEVYVPTLPPVSLAERFQLTVNRQIELMMPHRETLAALFGSALNPQSKVGVFGESTADVRRQSRDIYITIVMGAKDAPRAAQVGYLATVLYGMHLAMVLFWLIDRSEDTRRTHAFIAFLHDMLNLIRPLLRLPPVSKAVARLAHIIGPMLGDDEGNVS